MRENYQKAMGIMAGYAGEPGVAEMNHAQSLLSQMGDFPPALCALSTLEAMSDQSPNNMEMVCKLYLKAAKTGFPPAVRGLGVILLGRKETWSMGAGLLRRAVQSGDWIASFLMLREAGRGNIYAGKSDLTQMFARLPPDVPFYNPMAQTLAAVPDRVKPLELAAFKEEICRDGLMSTLGSRGSVQRRLLNEKPCIEALPSALSVLECDYLIALSAPLMQPSKVVDADEAGAVGAGFRTSDGAVLLPAHMDLLAICMLKQLSELAGIAPEQGEFLSLLRYRPGQEYRPHHDYLLPDAADYSRVKACGQRRSTLLTYLNEGYVGGETAFPELGITYKGAPGDALLFQNADVSGVPLPASLHAGTPVSSGEKWLMTLWCREKPFWPWMRGS